MIGRSLVVGSERNARLEAAGVGVVRVPVSELSGSRGGPRSLCCAIGRDPAVEPGG